MPMTIEVLFNKFPAIAAELPVLMDEVADKGATTLYQTAVDTSPVDTGAMQASHLKEKTGEGQYEVSVQKEAGLAGEKTYALFVNGGTIHMAAQPWFTDACVKAGDELQAATLAVGGL